LCPYKEAVNKQNSLLQHTTTIYLNEQTSMYAAELAAKMPGDLKVVYLVNSGSEVGPDGYCPPGCPTHLGPSLV
jgi:acetylornithine/succinyldiaminopimelate/putrescine aminotransferase